MKKSILLLFMIVLTIRITANQNEGQIRAYRTDPNTGQQYEVAVDVKVLYYDNAYSCYRVMKDSLGNLLMGTTKTQFNGGGFNGVFNVHGVSGVGGGDYNLFSEIPFSKATTGVTLLIGNVYFTWTFVTAVSGQKVITGITDTDFYYDVDNQVITQQRTGVGGTETLYFSVTANNYTIQVKNSFSGGTIQFYNDETASVPTSGTGYYSRNFNVLEFPVSITAMPDQPAAQCYFWNYWDLGVTTTLTKSLSTPDNYQLTAKFNGAEVITFKGEAVTINSTTAVAENNSYKAVDNTGISIVPSYKTINYIEYDCVSWKKNGEMISQQPNFTYTPTNICLDTLLAVTKGTVVNGYRSQHFNDIPGQNVIIYWKQHPSTSVTSYKIYRKVRHNGTTGSPELIGTVARSSNLVNDTTHSFTDENYVVTSTYSDDLLYYDVKGYYAPDSTYSTDDYVAEFGKAEQASMQKMNTNLNIGGLNTIPNEFKIGNFPNPFNPSTIIQYSLPEECNVVLKVYNILGQEVATLVNETKGAGVYQISFNATHLPSGIYIARLQAGSKIMITKLQYLK